MDNSNPIEEARRNAGVSLSALSTQTGIPRTTLRRLIANPHRFTLAQLVAVAEFLSVDADTLFAHLADMKRVAA